MWDWLTIATLSFCLLALGFFLWGSHRVRNADGKMAGVSLHAISLDLIGKLDALSTELQNLISEAKGEKRSQDASEAEATSDHLRNVQTSIRELKSKLVQTEHALQTATGQEMVILSSELSKHQSELDRLDAAIRNGPVEIALQPA